MSAYFDLVAILKRRLIFVKAETYCHVRGANAQRCESSWIIYIQSEQIVIERAAPVQIRNGSFDFYYVRAGR